MKKHLMELSNIIHLAGCGIADKKWTRERMKEILDTRVKISLN